jgi:hypothetical protein
MRLSDDVYSEIVTALPGDAPASWYSAMSRGPRSFVSDLQAQFSENERPRFLETLALADQAIVTRPKSLKARKRSDAWLLHLVSDETILASWCPRSTTAVNQTALPEAYLGLLDISGRLVFHAWSTNVLDTDEIVNVRTELALGEYAPFFPCGNGDYDVFAPDHKVWKYDHETAHLKPLVLSFSDWLEVKFREYWRDCGTDTENAPTGT